MEQKANKKGMGTVVALAVAILIGVIMLTVVVVNVLKENSNAGSKEDTTLYTLAGVENTTEKNTGYFNWDETTGQATDDQNTNANDSNNVEAGGIVTVVTTTKKSNGYDPVAEYEKLTKNGDNQLSDHHNNKYIKLVAQKYKVDTELLVAIYSEPDTGNNFVLEFSGKRDEDGNVIKSPDTLTKVYQIDKNKNISVATGKTTGNIGVSYAEGTLCFNMIKTIVMPQYPEYFTGVEK